MAEINTKNLPSHVHFRALSSLHLRTVSRLLKRFISSAWVEFHLFGVLQCFGNLKILPFWRCRLENIQMLWMLSVLWSLLWRLLSQVAKKKLVPLVIHITGWKIYQRENQEHALQWAIKMGKARSVWEQAPKKCAVMVIKLLSFCSVFFFLQTRNQRSTVCQIIRMNEGSCRLIQ